MRILSCALLALMAGGPVFAQANTAASPAVLTLDEAIALARRNNPTHLQTRSARERAGAALRSSYGAFLPQISTGFAGGYREGRQQFFGGQAFGSTSDVISTDARLDVSAQYSLSTFMAPKVERATLAATEADITNSEATLRATVANQYLTALQAQARAVLQDSLLVSTQAQLELARARQSVGAATTLDVRQAEVQVGQQQVAVIRERNTAEIEKLRLFQQMGVQQPENVTLTTEFPVSEPNLQVGELLNAARRSNPALEAARSRERAADTRVSQARAAYTPTLRLSTGISGFTSQERDFDLNSMRQGVEASRAGCFETDAIRQAAGLESRLQTCLDRNPEWSPSLASAFQSQNEKYPFDFTRDPINFSVSLSLPIFNGFQREQGVQEAATFRNDARYNVRAQELRLIADVSAAHRNLNTAYQTVRLQESNSQAAREALALAQERFRVGASTFVDLTQARAAYEQAETDRINAIYEFHKAFAALESAVGRPLR